MDEHRTRATSGVRIEQRRARVGPGTLWSAAHQLLTTDIRPKLARIQAPALVVWGEHDLLVPLELGRQLCRHLAAEALVVIKSAGHNPMWDCPSAFNRVTLEFLSGTATTHANHARIAACSPS